MAGKSVVYLEDIQPAGAVRTKKEKSEVLTETTEGKVSLKRQRTLEDMFGGSKDASSDSFAKKSRLSASGSASSVTRVSGLPKLNAIQFSLSEYETFLSDEERRLLALECQVMGRSWQVSLGILTFGGLMPVAVRLKMLKDEIRKPYFLSLKQFLWQEGVRGADSSPKVYPSRKC